MTAMPLRKFDPRRIAASLLMQNVAALYGVQVGRKLIPLVTIPYLARVLGIAGWGKVAFVTAVSEFVVIAIEFGFNLSATREIARHRNSPVVCGEVMSGVLGAQALLALVGVSLAVMASRWIPLRRPTLRLILKSLRMGWPMFVFRSAESLYGVGNALLLGLFAGPEIVGYFASAEKISKAAYGLLTPIRDSLFPRLSHLAKSGGMGAAALAKQGAAVMIGGGILLGGGIFATAPLLIRLVLG